MSSSALMSIGTRALSANYAALQATGHNISNANTPGYSRQTTVLESAGGQFSGAGFFGKGVLVTTTERAHSEYLTNEAATARALAAADETRSRQLQQLEAVFKTGEAGLGYAAGQLFNAFADVASKPQDASARQVALARADELAASFRSAGAQIETLQSGVTQDLKVAVASVNGLTRQIADLNNKIAASKGAGHEPNDLLDQRELVIDKLSEYVRVTTIAADDGTTSVFLGGGQALVLGNIPTELAVVRNDFDATRTQIALVQANGTRTLPDDLLGGGTVAGLLRFQGTDLAEARNLLGQMAAAIAGAVNTQQSLGLDLGRPAGRGAPMFSTGVPGVAAAAGNAAGAGGVPVASYIDANGNRVPSVGIGIVDAAELRASDYELTTDPAGAPATYQLTRLSDGQVRSVVDGDVADGFRINVVNPLPVAGDRFLLRPVGAAASAMQRVLSDPKGIAAASPVNATVAAANTGTATVATIQATSTALNPNLTATLTFTDNIGGYSYSLVDSTGVFPTTNGVGTWTAGQPIALNGWSLQLAGVPRSGDVVSVQKTAFPATDNGNANAMIGLRDAALIGRETLGNGTVIPGDTVTDAYANLLADVGVRVQGAKLAAQQSATVASDAKAAVSDKSGVNLDEEAARLIQYQQSYQAAAKMLQVAQSVFETLLQMAGA
jgi:flagellar hook-associated protein 1 FlgK